MSWDLESMNTRENGGLEKNIDHFALLPLFSHYFPISGSLFDFIVPSRGSVEFRSPA